LNKAIQPPGSATYSGQAQEQFASQSDAAIRHRIDRHVPRRRWIERVLIELSKAALVRHIFENEMLNGEVIRLDGAIRTAPQ
jgi:hypothetical protein